MYIGQKLKNAEAVGVHARHVQLSGTATQDEVGIFEPQQEKTGLWIFQPSPTQTGLYSHRSKINALSLKF